MVDIPTNKNIIKNKKVNTQMQTETGSRLTPTSNFTMPVTEGASAIKIVDNVSQLANKLADKQAINIVNNSVVSNTEITCSLLKLNNIIHNSELNIDNDCINKKVRLG